MNLYWVYGKKDFIKFSNLLKKENIDYTKEIKLVLLNNTLKRVYVFSVNDTISNKVEELLKTDNTISVENYISKHIEFRENTEKNNNKLIVQKILIYIFTFILLLFPVGLIENMNLSIVLAILKWIVITSSIVYSMKHDALAIIALLLIERFVLYIWTDIFFNKYSFEIIDEHKYMLRSNFFLIIIGMIVTLVIGTLYGFKKYNRKSLLGKFKFALLIIVGYVIIMHTTISEYANLFEKYHNELYWKYQEILIHTDYTVDLNSTKATKKIRTDKGYEEITGYFNKDSGSTYIDISPYKIEVDIYDMSNSYIKSYTIEPPINTIIEARDTAGSANISNYLYYSYITYFTIGYGEIFPVAYIMKDWIIQESIISNMMSLLIVPILLIFGQIFIFEGKEDNLKLDGQC